MRVIDIMTRAVRAIATALLLAVAPALAQDNAAAPAGITLPGINDYSLPPSRTATPTPTPSPTATPPPVIVTRPAPAATAAPEATLRPRPTPRPAASPLATPPPAASIAATVDPSPPVVEDLPPPPSPTPQPVPATTQGQGSGWPWIGAALAALAVLIAMVLWRRQRRSSWEDEDLSTVETLAETSPPPAPDASPQAPAPQIFQPPASAASPAPREGLSVAFRPLAVAVGGPQVVVEFELIVANAGPGSADAIRPLLALSTAGPDLAGQIVAFHAGAPLAETDEAFSLAPGASHRIVGELAVPREALHVATAGDRPIVVPVAVINLRWRGGLSVRTYREALIIGTGGAGGKLGAFALDRGPRRSTEVAARRFDVT